MITAQRRAGRASLERDPEPSFGTQVGARVVCSRERRPVGRVRGWLDTPMDGPELLVRSGWWRPVVRRVAFAEVVHADSRTVLLGIDLHQFLRTSLYLPDPEVQQSVFESLRAFTPLRYTTIRCTPIRSIGVDVSDGVARLSGHVATESHRRAAVRRV